MPLVLIVSTNEASQTEERRYLQIPDFEYQPGRQLFCQDIHQNLQPNFRIALSISSRSQWPPGLRRRSTAAGPLKLWVRIPPGAWLFVCCECCVLSGRSLCDGLITRPEESYQMWCVVVCDQETSNEEVEARYWAVENTTKRVVTSRKQTATTNKPSISNQPRQHYFVLFPINFTLIFLRFKATNFEPFLALLKYP